MTCKRCGMENPDNAANCIRCGELLFATTVVKRKKIKHEKLIVVLLVIIVFLMFTAGGVFVYKHSGPSATGGGGGTLVGGNPTSGAASEALAAAQAETRKAKAEAEKLAQELEALKQQIAAMADSDAKAEAEKALAAVEEEAKKAQAEAEAKALAEAEAQKKAEEEAKAQAEAEAQKKAEEEAKKAEEEAKKAEEAKKKAEHTHYYSYKKSDNNNHKKICSQCGETVNEKHTWDGGKVTKQPTETSNGVKTYTCTACKETKTEQISKLAHTHNYGAWSKADNYNHKQTCSCGNAVTQPHVWNAGTITKEATEYATGVRTYICTVCKATKTEEIPKLAPHTHVFGNWAKEDESFHKKTCNQCVESITEYHSWDGGRVTKAATEAETGIKTYICTGCNSTKTEEIPKLVHTHSYQEWENVNSDLHKKTCSCGSMLTESHTWDPGKVTKEATDSAQGVRTYTCTGCRTTRTESIPKLKACEHNYIGWVKADDTYHHQKCTICGNVETEAHKMGYTFKDGGDTHTLGCSVCSFGTQENHNFVSGKCECGAVESGGPDGFEESNLAQVKIGSKNIIHTEAPILEDSKGNLYLSLDVVLQHIDYSPCTSSGGNSVMFMHKDAHKTGVTLTKPREIHVDMDNNRIIMKFDRSSDATVYLSGDVIETGDSSGKSAFKYGHHYISKKDLDALFQKIY